MPARDDQPPKKKARGRPRGSGLKITPQKKQEILAVLAVSASRNDAADYVGVGRSTLSATITRDAAFAEQIKKAEAQGKLRALTKIHSDKSWQSSAWMLERKYPDQFGRKSRDDIPPPPPPEEQRQEFRYTITPRPAHPEPKPDADKGS